MKFFVIAALLASTSALRLSADPKSEHQNEEIGSTPSIAKVAEAAAKKVVPQPVAWDKDTLPNCPGADRTVMDDGKTHATKYPYVGASCKAQVSSSSLVQLNDDKSEALLDFPKPQPHSWDPSTLPSCPTDGRTLLDDGKTHATKYPMVGATCQA